MVFLCEKVMTGQYPKCVKMVTTKVTTIIGSRKASKIWVFLIHKMSYFRKHERNFFVNNTNIVAHLSS